MKPGAEQNQEVSGESNHVAGRDIHKVHIEINFPAREEPEAWCREIESHKKFKKEIGIECSHPARHALSRLLTSHNFTPRQIKVAWRNTTLKFDDELRRLVSLPSKVEAMTGFAFFVFALLMVSPSLIRFITSPKTELIFLPAFTAYVFMMAILSKQLIEPYLIGRRLERAFEAEKMSGQSDAVNLQGGTGVSGQLPPFSVGG